MIKSKEHNALEIVDKTLSAHLKDINTTSTINSLILSVCFIDVLAGFYSGFDGKQKNGVGKRFKQFTEKYLPKYSANLWEVRNGLVHSLENVGNFIFNESNEFSTAFPQVNAILGHNLFDVKDFKKSVEIAYENYIHDVSDTDNQIIRNNFMKRFESLGLIKDFPVGVIKDFNGNIITNIDDAPKMPGLNVAIGIAGNLKLKS